MIGEPLRLNGSSRGRQALIVVLLSTKLELSQSLNGFIKEELYMMQPEGFVNPKGANKICKLQRSIYGLVQASRS